MVQRPLRRRVSLFERGVVISTSRVRASRKPQVSEPKTIDVAELSASLERALTALGDQAVMSPDARRRGPKFPAGGERIAELLLQIAEQHGVFLPPNMKIDPDTIRRRLRDATELRPVVARSTLVNAALTDRARTSEREAWHPTLALYRLLQTLAVRDNALAVSLAPVQELFSRPRKARTVRPPSAPKEVKMDRTGLPRQFEEAPGAPRGAYRARRERAFVFPWAGDLRQ